MHHCLSASSSKQAIRLIKLPTQNQPFSQHSGQRRTRSAKLDLQGHMEHMVFIQKSRGRKSKTGKERILHTNSTHQRAHLRKHAHSYTKTAFCYCGVFGGSKRISKAHDLKTELRNKEQHVFTPRRQKQKESMRTSTGSSSGVIPLNSKRLNTPTLCNIQMY